MKKKIEIKIIFRVQNHILHKYIETNFNLFFSFSNICIIKKNTNVISFILKLN